MMIFFGGIIGIGLFFVSGGVIYLVGFGGVLIVYVVIGIMVYFLMISLVEFVVYMFVIGFFSMYVIKFVDLLFGFVFGWNYWYNWVIMIVVELVVVILIMKFWFLDIFFFIWSGLCLVIIFFLNYLFVKGFGEFEYWFVFIKVVMIIIFLIVGFMMIFGIMGGEMVGFKNFIVVDVLFNGGIMVIIGVFMVVGFLF